MSGVVIPWHKSQVNKRPGFMLKLYQCLRNTFEIHTENTLESSLKCPLMIISHGNGCYQIISIRNIFLRFNLSVNIINRANLPTGSARTLFTLCDSANLFTIHIEMTVKCRSVLHHCVVIFSGPQTQRSWIECCLHLKIEFCSCARGRQWCGIFHYHWWTIIWVLNDQDILTLNINWYVFFSLKTLLLFFVAHKTCTISCSFVCHGIYKHHGFLHYLFRRSWLSSLLTYISV